MSGGLFNYQDHDLAWEMYGAGPSYGKEGFEEYDPSVNPMENVVISELVWDVLVLIHSFDWYKSGDTSDITYKKDLEYFKDKWLSKNSGELCKEMIMGELERQYKRLKDELEGMVK